LKEAEALSRCHHSGIVDVIDYFEANGTAYAVLGYVEGQQMGHWLSGLGRPPTQAELDRILDPLLEALEVVHKAKLLHRDIAPDNILIKPNGLPCLIDFGACREDIRERSQKVSAIVKHGYSPPEQYHGLAELQGPWSDIYSLGATLYRAVSGLPPMDSARRGALGDSLKPVAEVTTAEYRPGFLAAIDKALRLKPEERPQSVSEWREMLYRAEASPPPPPPTPRPGPPRRDDPPGPVVEPPKPSPVIAWPRWALPVGIGLAVLVMLGMAVAFSPARKDAEAEARTAWAAIATTTDVSAVERFLAVHGSTKVAEAARARIESLNRSALETKAAAAWEKASGSGSIEDIERFIDQYGGTSLGAKARDRLAELRRIKEAKQKTDAATRQLEQEAGAAWSKLVASTDTKEIEAFLTRYGRTSYGERARARLSVLGLSADRRRELDAQWIACSEPAGGNPIDACTKVINGDEDELRRPRAYVFRARSESAAGQLDAAIADYTKSLELGSDPAVFNERGSAYLRKGDRVRALRDFDESLRIFEDLPQARNNRAWTLYLEGRSTDALKDANAAIKLSPGMAEAYDTRGHIYEALGRREEAIRDYTKALELDQGQDESRKGLERLKAKK
ncbi:MAG: tetratricopeptide repeat protein, partial [Proteobacteria bacterium]|nr:tetratricopeptide repeat protein [Pseudomonadota bacterium]